MPCYGKGFNFGSAAVSWSRVSLAMRLKSGGILIASVRPELGQNPLGSLRLKQPSISDLRCTFCAGGSVGNFDSRPSPGCSTEGKEGHEYLCSAT